MSEIKVRGDFTIATKQVVAAAAVGGLTHRYGWQAHLKDNPGVWEAGVSEAEAIGKLIISLEVL